MKSDVLHAGSSLFFDSSTLSTSKASNNVGTAYGFSRFFFKLENISVSKCKEQTRCLVFAAKLSIVFSLLDLQFLIQSARL
jgi:hypothetical protein